MHECVLGVIFFATIGSSCASKYEPNNTLQCLLKSGWLPVNISLSEYFFDTTFLAGTELSHINTKYTRCIVIWDGRHAYRSVVIIPLTWYLTILIDLSSSPKCSHDDLVLTYNFNSLFFTFKSYMFIRIVRTINPPLPYKWITLFRELLIWPSILFGTCSRFKNLILLCEVIRDATPLKNSTSDMSVKK